MPSSRLLPSLRPATDPIPRLRTAFLAIAVGFWVAQPLGVLATSQSAVAHAVAFACAGVSLAACAYGHRRGAFSWRLRALIGVVALVAAPALGMAAFGAAMSMTMLLSVYDGARPKVIAAWFSACAALGDIAAARHGAPLDPGALASVICTLVVLAHVLQRLRESLDERRMLEGRLVHAAHHDPLTGLANRAWFAHQLDAALERRARTGEPYAVLLLDLDDFKQINDTHGHLVGDRLLQEVARRAAAGVRDADRVARLGGDEFAVLLEHCRDVASAQTLADRLVEAIGRPVEVTGRQIEVRASVGLAWDAETAQAALAMADRAMYVDKADASESRAAAGPGGRPGAWSAAGSV